MLFGEEIYQRKTIFNVLKQIVIIIFQRVYLCDSLYFRSTLVQMSRFCLSSYLLVPIEDACQKQNYIRATPLKIHDVKQIANRVSFVQQKCPKDEIIITNNAIIEEWFSIFCNFDPSSSLISSFYEPIALNRYLARAVQGLEPDTESTSRRNVINCLEQSLNDVYEILEDVESTLLNVTPTWQVDHMILKLVELFHRSIFAYGLFDCLDDDDIQCMKNFNHDQNKILCNQLGLKEEITNLLPDGEIKSHKSFIDWVIHILKTRYDDVRDHNNSMAALQSLGFTPTAAAVLTNWIDSTASMSHKDLLYWVIYHIKSLSDVIIMQLGNETEFPFNKAKIIESYSIQVTGSMEFSISGRNILYDQDFQNNQRVLLKKMLPKNNSDEEFCFWYHGTLLKHEENIRNNGIDLSCAGAGDFSKNGFGFYLAEDIQHAIDFAKAKVVGDRIFSVIVFKVGKNFRQRYKGIDLTDENQLWRDAIHYYNNYQKNGKLKEPKALRKMQYIEGPTSKYDGGGRRTSSFHQLCIKNDHMSDFFFSKLCCIFYFKF